MRSQEFPVPKAKTAATPQTITLGNIPTIVTAKPPKKAGNPEIVMQGIADLTAIDRVIEDLEDAKKAVDTKVREAANKMLLDEGCVLKRRPGNFHGIETEVVNGVSLTHSVSIELRNSGAALSEEAIRVAEEFKIPTEEKVSVSETYIINPDYSQNMDVMQKVVDALNAAISSGSVPADILQFQPGSKKTVCIDTTLPAVALSTLPQPLGGTVRVDPTTDLMTVSDEFTTSIVISRSCQMLNGGLRWKLRLDTGLRPDITVAIRMDEANRGVFDYYLLPSIDISMAKLRLREENGFFLDAYRFDSLDSFFYLAARTQVRMAS